MPDTGRILNNIFYDVSGLEAKQSVSTPLAANEEEAARRIEAFQQSQKIANERTPEVENKKNSSLASSLFSLFSRGKSKSEAPQPGKNQSNDDLSNNNQSRPGSGSTKK